MKIAIVGAGALGTVYGGRLALVAPVTFVVRDLARAPKKLRLEKVNAGKADTVDLLDAPPAATEIPAECDVVLVTVRVDQLSSALLDALAHGGPDGRIVVFLTPLLPASIARVRAAIGERLVVGMPGISSYSPDDADSSAAHYRYWTPKAASTALQGRPPSDPRAATIAALAEALVTVGIPSEIRKDVETMNPATTIAFYPLLLAIDAGGTIAQLVDDASLLKLALAASKETRALAKTVGCLAGFASLLLSFAGTFTVRAGIKLARSRSPESLVFLEKHFGGKLRAQNAAMLREIRALGAERDVPLLALGQLADKAGVS